jgi:uncharacterized protein (TIGR00255 family)
MMQSMTGFATKTISITKGKDQKATITISLKALNSRYFETNIKLPQPLSHLETDLIKLFKKTLYRGSIFLTVWLDNPAIFKGSIEPAMQTVSNYMKAIKQIKKEFSFEDAPTLDLITRLPNVFTIEEQVLDKQSSQEILKAAHELTATVVKEREKEGKQLQKDLERRFASMEKEIAGIDLRYQEHMEEQKKKLRDLMQELGEHESELGDVRKSALYTLLDKIDINEEIVRFKSHLKNIQFLLDTPEEEKGKRIDFTLQELAREINTITAKCSDAQISKRAINVKVEIEKAREQTQNIV